MSIVKDFETIMNYAHMWNWVPDWDVVKDIYGSYPQSYSVLTPFAYAYLEELIRSTTSEYGKELYDKDGNAIEYRKVGLPLIKLAITENSDSTEYVGLLEQAKQYFKSSTPFDVGDNRNSVNHGYMHPRFWSKESFEDLVHFISLISPYSKF